ncbi:MAG: hypothetical protein H8E15_07910 [Planctomycetes bacterium]|nr:hypothetical protein [Planctomycetota bacterium]
MLIFLAHLLVTTVLVVATLWTGRKARRSQHYSVAVAAILSLLLTVREAGLYGKGFTFDTTRLSVHLVFAGLCMAALPGLIYSGFKLRKNPYARGLHQRWILFFLLMLLATFTTAGWMFMNAIALDA